VKAREEREGKEKEEEEGKGKEDEEYKVLLLPCRTQAMLDEEK
jgi:hypothetical protein